MVTRARFEASINPDLADCSKETLAALVLICYILPCLIYFSTCTSILYRAGIVFCLFYYYKPFVLDHITLTMVWS